MTARVGPVPSISFVATRQNALEEYSRARPHRNSAMRDLSAVLNMLAEKPGKSRAPASARSFTKGTRLRGGQRWRASGFFFITATRSFKDASVPKVFPVGGFRNQYICVLCVRIPTRALSSCGVNCIIGSLGKALRAVRASEGTRREKRYAMKHSCPSSLSSFTCLNILMRSVDWIKFGN